MAEIHRGGAFSLRKTHSLNGLETLRRLLSLIWFPALGAALVLSVLGGWLIFRGTLPGDGFFRPLMETISPWLLAVAMLIAAIRWVFSREVIFVYFFLLAGILLAREFHFAGTGGGVYSALGTLFYLAWCNFSKLENLFARRNIITGVALQFFLYSLSTSLDRSVWRFLPHRRVWSSPLEELIETIGHICLIMVLLLVARHASTLLPPPPGFPNDTADVRGKPGD